MLEKEIELIKTMSLEGAINEDIEDAIDHGLLVSKLAVMLSKRLKMKKSLCNEMAIAGMIHDIGKLKLGEYLYGRQLFSLKVEEMKYVRMHSKISYEILLERASYSNNITLSILHHHENMDGSGYPSNLKAQQIPYGARILRPCDVFAALVSERPYREAFDINTTMELMVEEVKNFDMKIFLTFMNVVHDKGFEEVKQLVGEINERSKRRYRGMANQRFTTAEVIRGNEEKHNIEGGKAWMSQ